MIKKMSLRKIAVSTTALIICGLFYFFPTSTDDLKIKETITYYDEEDYKSVYLMDKYNYVSKLKLPIEEERIESIALEKMEYLITNSTKTESIPSGFRSIIPINTKVLDLKIEGNTITINFSKELLNINLKDEESMIEAIIFTLTEIDEIENVKILVEGNPLLELPNSKKKLTEVLDRNYGINKIYDFDTLSDLTKTTVYYVNKMEDDVYYTPVTKVTNDTRDKVTVIIDELKSSIIYQSNLSSYLSAAAELNKYEIIEDTMILSFNDKIFSENSKNILEEVEYTISMSLMDNYDINEVIFYVGDEKITTTTLKTLE